MALTLSLPDSERQSRTCLFVQYLWSAARLVVVSMFVLVQVWTLQEGKIPGVRLAAGTCGGLSMSNKALPLNEHKGSTIIAVATDESGTLSNVIPVMRAFSSG